MIDRSELYGRPGVTAADVGAAVTEAAQVATWRIPHATPPDGPLAPPFLARSLLVDNPTGRWWRINGRAIPPWTIGAVVPVEPPSAQLTVEAYTPAGQLSEATGDELVIVARDLPAAPHPGIYRPPALAITPTRVRLGVSATVNTLASGTVLPAIADRMVIVSLELTAGISGATWLEHAGVELWTEPAFVQLADLMLSRAVPSVSMRFEPGALVVPAGEAVKWGGGAKSSKGIVGMFLEVAYHLSPAEPAP